MYTIPLFVIIPLAGAFLISFVGKYSKRASDGITTITTLSLVLFALNTLFLLHAQHAPLVYKVGGWGWIPNVGTVGISLVLDSLTAFMLVTVNCVVFMITLFSVNYMEKFTAKHRFYTLYLFMLAGMNGVIISGDLFNLFVFLEIASLASYPLVAFGVEAQEIEASFKYMVMGIVASLCILLGIAFLYSYTSTLNMADIAQALAQKGTNKAVSFASVLLIMGFALKAAIVPFHAWLPDAHSSAPAPISATLSSVLIKTLGIYALCRVFFNVININHSFLNLLMFAGAISIMVGGLLALGQNDLKRLLAYSSISQVGYIILGLGIGTPWGILGALFHLLNHSVFKSLLFLNSGAIEYTLGTRNLDEMGGLREKMPVTAATSLIASMGICGIPPFSGFFSKLLIIIACIASNHIAYGIWAILGSILTISYFMKVQKQAFFGTLPEKYKNIKEVPLLMKATMIVLSCICIGSGALLLPQLRGFLLQPAQEIISKGLDYKNVALRTYEK